MYETHNETQFTKGVIIRRWENVMKSKEKTVGWILEDLVQLFFIVIHSAYSCEKEPATLPDVRGAENNSPPVLR